MKLKKIPMNCIRRMTKYYYIINNLIECGNAYASSAQIASYLDLSASQVRLDLNEFGAFGYRGCGYDLRCLKETISSILGLDCEKRIVLVGTGCFRVPLLKILSSGVHGFRLVAVFDGDEDRQVSTLPNGVNHYHISLLEEYVSTEHIKAVALCVSDDNADWVVGKLIDSGIQYIWNLTNAVLTDKSGRVCIHEVSLLENLLTFGYRILDSSAVSFWVAPQAMDQQSLTS